MLQPYRTKLHDQRWQALRELAFAKYGKECACCGSTSRLNVHHKIYGDEPWLVETSGLQVLCQDCHYDLGPHKHGGIWWGSGGKTYYYAHCTRCGGEVDTWEPLCLVCGHRIAPKRQAYPVYSVVSYAVVSRDEDAEVEWSRRLDAIYRKHQSTEAQHLAGLWEDSY